MDTHRRSADADRLRGSAALLLTMPKDVALKLWASPSFKPVQVVPHRSKCTCLLQSDASSYPTFVSAQCPFPQSQTTTLLLHALHFFLSNAGTLILVYCLAHAPRLVCILLCLFIDPFSSPPWTSQSGSFSTAPPKPTQVVRHEIARS